MSPTSYQAALPRDNIMDGEGFEPSKAELKALKIVKANLGLFPILKKSR